MTIRSLISARRNYADVTGSAIESTCTLVRVQSDRKKEGATFQNKCFIIQMMMPPHYVLYCNVMLFFQQT